MSRRNKTPFWKPQSGQPQNFLKPIQNAPHVMVCVFTNPERHGWVNPGLTTVLMRLSYDPRLKISYAPIHAIYPACEARNTAVEKYFLRSDAEILVIFDNDVEPPANIGDAIAGMPKDCNIAVMPYWVWLPSEKHTMVCFGKWEDGTMIHPNPADLKPGWQVMGAGGTGCMFIRRKVFESPEKFAAPFFKIISTERRGQVVSEDIYFTGLAAEAGFPTWTNTDFVCSHYHTVDLAEVNQGIVQILNKFIATQESKGDICPVSPAEFIKDQHPEMKEAEKFVADQAPAVKEPTLPLSEWVKK